MLISTCYFFLFRSHDQIVIPIRMRDPTSQIMNGTVGKAPDFMAIFMNAMIPVTTTMMVSVRGILKGSIIFRPFLIDPLTKTFFKYMPLS